MTDERETRLTRRTVLAASGGAVGALVLGSSTVASAQRVSFDDSQQVAVDGTDDEGVRLRVDWKEWANGDVVEQQDAPTERDSGATGVLQFPSLLPNDAGKLAIGLSVETTEGAPPPVAVDFRIREPPGSRRENGRNEPERKAGDDDAVGELQKNLGVKVWYDTGVQAAGVPLYGVCDATDDSGTLPFGPDAPFLDGTLEELSAVGTPDELEPETWRTLDTTPNNPVESGQCLGPQEGMCLVIEWSLTEETVNWNRLQGDSVSPVIELAARSCA